MCEHSLLFSRGFAGFTELSAEERTLFAPVRQRLVRTHPVSGRRSLYLSSHAGGIVGWPVPEARAFLRDLVEHATAARFLYVHRWSPHDLVVWDNRQTMHRVRRFAADQVRDMRRTTVAGDGPTVRLAENTTMPAADAAFPALRCSRARSPLRFGARKDTPADSA